MASFRYTALAASGEMITGEMEAVSRASVIDHLQLLGHWPIDATAADGKSAGWRLPFAGRRAPQRQLAMLMRELATLLQAGLPLDRSLAMLTGMTRTRRLRQALEDTLRRVRAGASLADALAAQKDTFTPLHVGMIRAGEVGGHLPAVLARLGVLLVRAQELRDTVISALVYPTVLLVLAGCSVLVVLTVMVPQFEPLFESAGAALPLSTQVLLALAHGLRDNGWMLLAGAGLLAALMVLSVSDGGRDRRLVLLDRLSGATFDYYPNPRHNEFDTPQSGEWRARWQAEQWLPGLIRLSVSFPPGDPRWWPDLIVAPKVDVDALCRPDPVSHGCEGR